jgi:hypothetical protein
MRDALAGLSSRKALALRILRILVPFGTVLVAWAHAYYRMVLIPMPSGWSLANLEYAGLGAAALLGCLARALSRRAIPVALGGLAGISGGAYRACVSDVTISAWQRVKCGWVGVYPAWLFATFIGSWAAVHLVVRFIRLRTHRQAWPAGG